MSDININQNEQAREAERAVLGGLMLETQRFDTVIQVIKENDFDGKDHQIIFQSMSELIEENKPLDPLTVSEKLDNKNSLKIFESINSSEFNVVIQKIHKNYLKRSFQNAYILLRKLN